MAFRLSRTSFGRLAIPSARVGARQAPRRAMSSSSHGTQGSDRIWIIGSALIFGPAAAYLLSPSAQSKAHDAQQHSLPKHKASEPENAPVPATPPPQEHAPAEPSPEPSVITDDEGNTASSDEVADSINKSVDNDSPKDAYAFEAGEQKETGGAASGDKAISEKAESPESGHVQSEKPSSEKDTSGTLQSKEDSGPSDIGDARRQAKSGNDPKEAKTE
ncbi:hypothetical protein BC835DRAFT_1089329 [Cytidiella melzeri]|nr:hypothetical protein BC835DRAFT_1089329 [Cytidiella melzeri]